MHLLNIIGLALVLVFLSIGIKSCFTLALYVYSRGYSFCSIQSSKLTVIAINAKNNTDFIYEIKVDLAGLKNFLQIY